MGSGTDGATDGIVGTGAADVTSGTARCTEGGSAGANRAADVSSSGISVVVGVTGAGTTALDADADCTPATPIDRIIIATTVIFVTRTKSPPQQAMATASTAFAASGTLSGYCRLRSVHSSKRPGAPPHRRGSPANSVIDNGDESQRTPSGRNSNPPGLAHPEFQCS